MCPCSCTQVSDMGEVLAWLDRHLDESKISHGKTLTTATSVSTLSDEPSSSAMEAMLSKWKQRATKKLEARLNPTKGAGGGQSELGMSKVGGKTVGGVYGESAGGWLRDLADDLEQEIAPLEVRASVWHRQRDLERVVDDQIAERARECKERRAKARAARRARSTQGMGGLASESDDDEEDAGEAEAERLLLDKFAAKRRSTSLRPGEDESVHKFMKQLPLLEARRNAGGWTHPTSPHISPHLPTSPRHVSG